MTFNSIEEMNAFIEQALTNGMDAMGEEMKRIMIEAIETDIYEDHPNTTGTRTGQLKESAQVSDITNTSVEVEYADNGDWESAISGEHFFPLEGFKSGSVWAPNNSYYSADPTETAFRECEEQIPELLKKFLQGQGIPLE